MNRLCQCLLIAALSFPAAARAGQPAGWQDYHIAMWQSHTPAALVALQSIGIDSAMVYAKSGNVEAGQLDAALAAGDFFYLENLATDIFAPYHLGGSSALFVSARAAHAAAPSDVHAFERQPSLLDPLVQDRLRQRLTDVVGRMRAKPPLFYNLADEPGLAETAHAWDFDTSPPAMADFRRWLETRYASLDALNAQWGSSFRDWSEAVPMLTDEALRRQDGNVSAWGDFKQWSDDMFAAAFRRGTDALHAADPSAVSALEGAQIPGWGGYDYSRLARSVDLMEIYDYGQNIEIARAINPDLVVLTTSFSAAPEEHHRLWHEVLLGARGHVIWDERNDFASAAGVLGRSGLDNAATYRSLRGGVPAQFIASVPMPAEVAILASMPSYRIEWLLARRAENKDWASRSIDDDYVLTPWRRSLDRAASGLAHLGVPATYLSPEMLAEGVPDRVRLLILPKTAALSDREAEAIRAFLARGGTALADGAPGGYDDHLRQRATPILQDVAAQLVDGGFLQADNPQDVADKLAPVLRQAGVTPMFSLTTPDGQKVRDVTARLWRNGSVVLVGLERDLAGRKVALGPEELVLSLSASADASAEELLSHAALGRGRRIVVGLDPVVPSVLAISPVKPPAVTVEAAGRSGGSVRLVFATPSGHPAKSPVMHIDVLDAAGHVLTMRNAALHDGREEDEFPAPPGAALLRVTDILGGGVVEKKL